MIWKLKLKRKHHILNSNSLQVIEFPQPEKRKLQLERDSTSTKPDSESDWNSGTAIGEDSSEIWELRERERGGGRERESLRADPETLRKSITNQYIILKKKKKRNSRVSFFFLSFFFFKSKVKLRDSGKWRTILCLLRRYIWQKHGERAFLFFH